MSWTANGLITQGLTKAAMMGLTKPGDVAFVILQVLDEAGVILVNAPPSRAPRVGRKS